MYWICFWYSHWLFFFKIHFLSREIFYYSSCSLWALFKSSLWSWSKLLIFSVFFFLKTFIFLFNSHQFEALKKKSCLLIFHIQAMIWLKIFTVWCQPLWRLRSAIEHSNIINYSKIKYNKVWGVECSIRAF